MSSHGSVNNDNNNNDNNGGNGSNGGEAVTKAKFTQLQGDVRKILERLEVRDRRSHGSASRKDSHHRSDASHRRRNSNGDSDESSARSRRQDDRQRDDRHRGLENIKLRIPPFTGSSKLDEFLDWVPRVEKVFDCYEWDERMNVKMASLAFSDYASRW